MCHIIPLFFYIHKSFDLYLLYNNKVLKISLKMLVSKEQIFSVPADSFAVSPSAEGYTLYYGVNAQFTAYTASTPANEVLVVKGIPKGMSFKLVGNNSDVFIQY